MKLLFFRFIFSFLLLCSCLTFELNFRVDTSLVSVIAEATKNGISCTIIIEHYCTKFLASDNGLLDQALTDARKLDDAYNEKKMPKGRFHCLPMLIWNADDEERTMTGNYTPSLKTMVAFDYFKKRGAIALTSISRKSLPLQPNYPIIIFGSGLSDQSLILNKIFGYPPVGMNTSICSVLNVIVFRLHSYRENICIAATCLKDLSILSKFNNEVFDTRELSDVWSMRTKNIGIIRGGLSFLSFDERSTIKLTERLTEGGASIKNLTINDNELSSILRHVSASSDCLKESNYGKNESQRSSDYWIELETNRSLASEQLVCWTATKKRYRYQIRFVKRIAEPLFGTNDFIVLPNIREDLLIDNSDLKQFLALMSQSHYPILQHNARCSFAGPIIFLARPDRLQSIIEAASELHSMMNEKTYNDKASDLISSIKSKTDAMNTIQYDYCGEMILTGITAGTPLFAYDLCGPNGMCINTLQGLKCDCVPGYSGRFCHEVAAPFAVVQKCVLYPTYQTVINNLTVTCPEQTSCIPSAHHCLLNYCENPHGWCLSMEDFIVSPDNSRKQQN